MAVATWELMCRYQNKITTLPITSSKPIGQWKKPDTDIDNSEYLNTKVVPTIYVEYSQDAKETYFIRNRELGTTSTGLGVTSNSNALIEDMQNYNNSMHVFFDYLYTYEGYKDSGITLSHVTGQSSSQVVHSYNIKFAAPYFFPVDTGTSLWKVLSEFTSFGSVMYAAEKLMKMIGVDSVKVVKKVPFKSTIDIE